MSKRKGELSTKKKSEYRQICGERDGWFCKKCGAPLIPENTSFNDERYFEKLSRGFCLRNGWSMPTLDHIIPLSVENITDISNFQLLCHGCNAKRRNKSWLQFLGQ